MSTKLLLGREFLQKQGLNLWAVLDLAHLPSEIQSALDAGDVPWRKYRRLVMIGNGGRRFWEALQEHGHITPDPVDYFSTTITRRFIVEYLGSPPIYWLYPANLLIPLQRLGEMAGWAHPSPLGLGISAQYGVWFAYRAAFLTTADLPLSTEPRTPSPCTTCVEKPCQTACPVGAVHDEHQFDVPTCAQHRLLPQSPCADRCFSRLACPIAPEHQYSIEQVRYYYGRSLITLREFFEGIP